MHFPGRTGAHEGNDYVDHVRTHIGQGGCGSLVGDLLKAYKLGLKTLYYQNTFDGKGMEEIEVNELHAEPSQVGGLTAEDLLKLAEEPCEPHAQHP